jgi:hypothetical protein
MRVLFERTGGFAGFKLQGTLESAALPSSQAHRLKQLLRQSRFFELPESLKSAGSGVDRFNYRITVETEEGSHTVEAGDAAVPGELRPLLDYLTHAFIAR